METRVFRTHPIFYQEFYPQQLSWGRLKAACSGSTGFTGPAERRARGKDVGRTWEGLASQERKMPRGLACAGVLGGLLPGCPAALRLPESLSCPKPLLLPWESSGPDLQTKHVHFPSTTQWWGTASLWDFQRRKRGEKKRAGKVWGKWITQ